MSPITLHFPTHHPKKGKRRLKKKSSTAFAKVIYFFMVVLSEGYLSYLSSNLTQLIRPKYVNSLALYSLKPN